METMLQQFSTMAADLHNVKTTMLGGSSNQHEHNEHNVNLDSQVIPHKAEIQPRSIRLDFPVFNGDNAHGWLYKVNHFFTYHSIHP